MDRPGARKRMTKADASELIAKLFAAYGQDFAPQTVAAYEGMILDLDRATTSAAICRLICTSKFRPSIAEIRAATLEQAAGHQRIGAEAWSDVLAEGRRVGTYGLPEFRDPLTAECVRQMGWRNLMTSSNDAADRARFIELYNSLSARGYNDAVSGKFALPAGNVGKLLTGIGGSGNDSKSWSTDTQSGIHRKTRKENK